MDFNARLIETLPELHHYARRLARNAGDAEDLVQDTIVRALRHQDRWSPALGTLRQWLMTLCLNRFIDGKRRAKLMAAHRNAQKPEPSVCAPQDIVVACRETADRMKDLSVPHRQLLLLVAVGMTYPEIGQAMRMPRGTVASTLSRARRALENAAIAALPDAGSVAHTELG